MDGSTLTPDIQLDLPQVSIPKPVVPAERVVRPRDWIAFTIMLFGMFMALLDVQIVSSSLADLQAGLSASADEISWVQTSYLIAEVVMIPLSGYLSRMMGTRLLFTLSAIGFTVMSLACATSWSLGSMVAFRTLQGFLGGAMIPTVFATAFTLFPPSKRAGVNVLAGLVATLAPTLGPTIGGYITQLSSWHWLFLINVMPGILVVVGAWLTVDVDRPDWSLAKAFDLPGFVLMAMFLGAIQYVLEEGARYDWLSDPTVFAASAIALLAGLGFFWRVFTAKQPIVELRAFKDRNFAVGTLYSFILGVGLYGSVYLIPAYLARVNGFNSLQIGEMMAITGVFQFISAPLAGALSKKMDLRVMMAMGFTLFGTGVYLSTKMNADWSYAQFFLPQAVRGIALMLCFLPVNQLALGTLAPAQIKNASGLYNLSRNLGGAIGLAVINTLLSDRLQFHWSRLSDTMTLSRPAVANFLNGLSARLGDMLPGDSSLEAAKNLAGLVYKQATVMAFVDCQLAMAAAFAFALMLMPLVRKPGKVAGGGH